MKRKILSTILVPILVLSIFPQTGFAAGADERTNAVEYVTANRIFIGDGNGNLNLESGLTRAELAVLLVRLRGDEENVRADINSYTLDCYFTDVPEWAKPYVGYCAGEGLMIGYSPFSFGSHDKVTPQQACTVMLRHMGLPETDWNYGTAVSKAASAEITPASGFSDMAAIKRVEMAILIYKAEMVSLEPAMTIGEMKDEIVRLTNIERVKAGLPELEVLPALMDTAQAKADDMLANHYYGHTSPVYGTPGDMIKAAIPAVKSCAENLASWTKTPQEVIAGMMDSPEHQRNMLSSKYTHIGVGIIEGANGGYWWVQHFAGL